MKDNSTPGERLGVILVIIAIPLLLWAANAWIDFRMKPQPWGCEHHPQHIAFTPDEIANATREHGCKNWTHAR